MVRALNCKSTKNAQSKSKIAKIMAFFLEIFLLARGRFLVLSTSESNFISTISLTTQPADLIKIAPRKNRKVICKIAIKSICGNFFNDKKIPKRQGKNNRKIPVG